jgi:hypothetical protein
MLYELIEQWLDWEDREKHEKKSGRAETGTEDTTIATRAAELELAFTTIKDILKERTQEQQSPDQERGQGLKKPEKN